MTDPTDGRAGLTWVLPGHPARRSVRWALWSAGVTGVAFSVWAFVTTQDHRVGDGAPWREDPYHGVVSFTAFLVPTLTALVLGRAASWRAGRAQPVFRLDQLTRAGTMIALLVALTVSTDWLAVVLRAERPIWDATTVWLITSLAPLTAGAAVTLVLNRAARRRLPRPAGTAPEGDWLDDLAAAVYRVTGTRIRRPLRVVRGHRVGFAVLASLLAGAGVVAAQAVGEGWDDPPLVGIYLAVVFGGFLAFFLIGNATLHIAVPRAARRSTREATPGRAPGRVRRAARITPIVVALALPGAAVSRDPIWALLGHHEPVRSVGLFAGITGVGALLAGMLAFAVGIVWPSPRPHVEQPAALTTPYVPRDTY